MSYQFTSAVCPQNANANATDIQQQQEPLLHQDETYLIHSEVGSSTTTTAESLNTQPTLRRVKTESSTLTTKEYFERRERERIEREASRLTCKPVKELVHPAAKLHTGQMSNQPDIVKPKHNVEMSKLTLQAINDSPTISNLPMLPQHQLLKSTSPPISRNLAMGDPSDQHPLNIFDCFQPVGSNAPGSTSVEGSVALSSHDMQRQQHPAGFDSTACVDRTKERRRSSRSDVMITSGHKPVFQPRADEPPVDINALLSNNCDQKSSKRKQAMAEASQPSPLKLKLSVSGAHRLAAPSDQPSIQMSAGMQSTESQERIRLKLNVSGGKVEKLTDTVASTSMGAVKLVLSKDKVSGEYQPGNTGHHHHHKHGHHSHKHSRSDRAHSTADDSSRKRIALAAAASMPKAPPEKMLRTDSSSLGNGHRIVTVGTSSSRSASHYYQQQQLDANPHIMPSTYRLVPPPPPPPPLPLDEPLAPPPPPSP